MFFSQKLSPRQYGKKARIPYDQYLRMNQDLRIDDSLFQNTGKQTITRNSRNTSMQLAKKMDKSVNLVGNRASILAQNMSKSKSSRNSSMMRDAGKSVLTPSKFETISSGKVSKQSSPTKSKVIPDDTIRTSFVKKLVRQQSSFYESDQEKDESIFSNKKISTKLADTSKHIETKNMSLVELSEDTKSEQMDKLLDMIDDAKPTNIDFLQMPDLCEFPKYYFNSNNGNSDAISISKQSHASTMSISERRRERGKEDLRYDPTEDLNECMSEAHFAELSFHEAMSTADYQIDKLNFTIKKCDQIGLQASRLKNSSRLLDKKMKELSSIL